MGTLVREARIALRMLGRDPGFAAAVTLIFALGIGVNTAIYSVLDAVILCPLAFPEPDRLVMVSAVHRPNEIGEEVSVGNFLDYRRESEGFEELGAFGPATLDLVGAGAPERVQAAVVTPRLLTAFGVKPLLGRLLAPEEEGPDSRVAVLTYGFWRSHLGGDPGVLGRTLRLSGFAYPVVGVLPADFHFPRRFDAEVELLIPLRLTPERVHDRGSRWLYAAGRLRRGVSLASVQRDMDRVTTVLAHEFPAFNQGWGVRIVPMREHLVGRVRSALLVVFATALLVLLVACANIGNLQLARATGRRAEMAIRSALGGSRSAILRPVLLEGMTLAFSGGLVGALLAFWGVRLLVGIAPPDIPRLSEIRIDGRALLFALVASILAGLLFGLLPAFLQRGADLADDLRGEGRGSVAGRPVRGRRLATAAEVAAAVVLMIGAGLLLSSLRRLLNVEPGFDPSDVTTLEVVLRPSRYPDDARRSAFFHALASAAARLPGVASAGGVSHLPLGGANSTEGYLVEGREPVDPNDIPEAATRTVTPGYFRTMRIPLLFGRDFTDQDRAHSPPVVLVNQAFAQRYWGASAAVGRRLSLTSSGRPGEPREVVGVVGDIRHAGLDSPPVPEIYVCYEQHSEDAMVLTVRSRASLADLGPRLRAEVARLDPEQPVFNLRPMSAVLAESASQSRFYATLLSGFASLALVLAAVGIHGVMAYGVAQRRREIGIRVALGARPGNVLSLVVQEGMVLGALGIVTGLTVAAAATQGMRSLLFGVGPRDPAIFITAAAILAGVCLAASLVPAAAAARADANQALRS